MRILTVLLLTACSALAQQASYNIQGTAERSYVTFWTENRGYCTAEIRTKPVNSILIADQNGKVILDSWSPAPYKILSDR
jgi:hypothetical protein